MWLPSIPLQAVSSQRVLFVLLGWLPSKYLGFMETFCSSWVNVYWVLGRIRHYASVRMSKFRSDTAIQANDFTWIEHTVLPHCTMCQGLRLPTRNPALFWLRVGVDESLHQGVSSFPLWTFFSITEGHGSQGVPLCVGVLSFFRYILTNCIIQGHHC